MCRDIVVVSFARVEPTVKILRPLKTKPLRSLETTDAKHSAALSHVPEGRRPQTQHCDNLKTCNRTKFYLAVDHSTTRGIPQMILHKIMYNETKKSLLINFSYFLITDGVVSFSNLIAFNRRLINPLNTELNPICQ